MLRIAWPALLLALLALLPFYDKAFTIDDPTFLEGARQVVRDPFHPTAFEIVWSKPYLLRSSQTLTGNTLMYYLLAPVLWAGGAEWLNHLLQYLWLAIGLLATVALALRFGLSNAQARAAALLVAATPAVLGMASTAMPDVAALMFATLTIHRALLWRDEQRWTDGLLLALLLALSILTRFHLAALAGVATLALYSTPFRLWVQRCWPIALGLAATVAFLQLTRDPIAPETSSATAAASWSSLTQVIPNLLAYLVHLALAVPLVLPLAFLRFRMLPWRLTLLLGPFACGIFLLAGPTTWLALPVVILSLLLLADLLRQGWWTDRVLLSWLAIPLVALPYIHMPAKFLVAAAAPIAILVARQVTPTLLRATVALGVTLGLLIIQADAKLAALGRQDAAELIAPLVKQGHRVWFSGSWGFYWYALEAGARPMSRTAPYPAPGDYVVFQSADFQQEYRSYVRGSLIERRVNQDFGGRIFGGRPRAGFYSNHWGLLPWSVGSDELRWVELWRMER